MPYSDGDIIDYPDGTALQLKGGAWVPYRGTSSKGEVPPVGNRSSLNPVVGSEGVVKTLPSGDATSILNDIKGTAGPEIARGIVGAGTSPFTLGELAASGVDWLGQKILPSEKAEAVSSKADAVKSLLGNIDYDAAMGGLEKRIGPLPHPQTTTGQIVGGGLQALPAMLGGEGSYLAKGVKAFGAGAAGEAAGQLASDDYKGPASIAGALLGARGPAIARKLATPFATTAERTAQANLLRSRGMPVSAGDATGSPFLKGVEENAASAPFAVPPEFKDAAGAKGKAYTREALKTMGVDSDTSHPVILNRGQGALQKNLNDLMNSSTLMFDPQMINGIRDARRELFQTAGHSALPEFDRQVNEIVHGPTGRPLPSGNQVMGMLGPRYQSLRSTLGGLAQKAKGTDLGIAYGKLQDTLDNAMERSLAGGPNAGSFPQFREQWANYRALGKANKGNTTGVLDPGRVYRNVKDPTGELGTLSSAAQNIYASAPKGKEGSDILPILGGLVGSAAQSFGLGDASVLGLLAAPHVAKVLARSPLATKTILSPTGQRSLANQRFLPSANTAPSNAAAVKSLLYRKQSEDEDSDQ